MVALAVFIQVFQMELNTMELKRYLKESGVFALNFNYFCRFSVRHLG